MRVDSFYTSKAEEAVLIRFLSKEAVSALKEERAHPETGQLKAQKFSGEAGQFAFIFDKNGALSKLYLGIEGESYRLPLATAAKHCPPGSYRLEAALEVNELIFWALEQYHYSAYKKHEDRVAVLVVDEPMLSQTLKLADAIFLVRDLINCPTNDMGPSILAQTMKAMAQNYQATFKQWVGEELLRENFPAIHTVGRAAADAPRLLSLRWGDESQPLVTLIGKGVCFDSGGLDLKPASAMRLMKKDMGGAAHVLGLAEWIMASKLPICLQVYVPAVENAVSGNAFRPGDVIRMRNGLSVEIDNTDAEGRLVLADAITKACEEKTSLIIDFATLTGAARTAVGTKIAAMFSNCDALAEAVFEQGQRFDDYVWRLPLFEPYKKLLRSNIADLANSHDGPYAGAITAALFLSYFVKEKTPWLHFDLMAWNLHSEPGRPEGGEAMALRAVAAYLLETYEPAIKQS